MPLKASRSYEPQIEDLLSKMEVCALPPRPSKSGFTPDSHISREFSDKDLLGDVVYTIPTWDGQIVGKAFQYRGKSIELKDNAWVELRKIAGGIQRAPDYRNAVSLDTLSELIFEWLKDTHKGTITQKPLDFLSDKCEPNIQEFEAWVPIAETHIEGELPFGNVIFKQVNKAMIDAWEVKCVATFPDRDGWPEHFDRWRRKVQGLAAATMKVKAEPKRAYEIIMHEAEQATSLLRCLSFVNGCSFLTSYSTPLGKTSVPSFKIFLTQDEMLSNNTEGTDDMNIREYYLTKKHIADLKNLGLDHLSALLKKTDRTEFENDLFSALLLYSRSSIQHTAADKLTYILASLEFLLSGRSIDSESLGERLALLNAVDLQVRKDVVRNTKFVCQMQPRLIRGEANSGDIEQLEKFMETAWTFFINLIPNAGQFKNKEEFIQQIEDWKLSGGLKGAI